MVLAGAGMLTTAFALARGLFTWRSQATFRRLEGIADTLADRVADEVARDSQK